MIDDFMESNVLGFKAYDNNHFDPVGVRFWKYYIIKNITDSGTERSEETIRVYRSLDFLSLPLYLMTM